MPSRVPTACRRRDRGTRDVERAAGCLPEHGLPAAGELSGLRRGGLSGALSRGGRPRRGGAAHAGAPAGHRPRGREHPAHRGGRCVRPRDARGRAGAAAPAGAAGDRRRRPGALGGDHDAGAGNTNSHTEAFGFRMRGSQRNPLAKKRVGRRCLPTLFFAIVKRGTPSESCPPPPRATGPASRA